MCMFTHPIKKLWQHASSAVSLMITCLVVSVGSDWCWDWCVRDTAVNKLAVFASSRVQSGMCIRALQFP